MPKEGQGSNRDQREEIRVESHMMRKVKGQK